MRGVRCQRCGHMFSLSVGQVVAALEELDEKGESHYGVECPRCRHLVKVPRGDLERMRPRLAEPGAEAESIPASPAPTEVPEAEHGARNPG